MSGRHVLVAHKLPDLVCADQSVQKFINNELRTHVALTYDNFRDSARLSKTNEFTAVQSFNAPGGTQLLVGTTKVNANPIVGDPPHLVDIVNDGGTYQVIRISSYGTGFANNVHWCRYRGTVASPSAVQSGDVFMSHGLRGWDSSGALSQSAAAFQGAATENWTGTAHGIKLSFEITPNGSITRALALELTSGLATFGDGAGQELLSIDGGAGNVRALLLRTNGSSRWSISVNTTAEAGANAGSNFELGYFNDAGSLVDNALAITRSTGALTLGPGGSPTTHRLNTTVATGATGGADTLPANPVGFIVVNINGTNRKIPYYAT